MNFPNVDADTKANRPLLTDLLSQWSVASKENIAYLFVVAMLPLLTDIDATM